ncbi:MAG: helix-turn-helix domain-containing protein [Candidatus Omnitrophica bacterium]|nr:helix-turn-helix domain-containing protein [Candidatus Omnitrophota bacterium]
MNNMLTFEEVKNFLDVEQSQVEKFLENGKLRAYKIGGTYIRFRKEEVLNLRFEIMPQKTKLPKKASLGGSLLEFWRFNNFYILSILIVAALVAYFIKT